MTEPYQMTASQLARRVRARETSPVEIVESLLARMDSLERQLQAWVYVDRETVLADARQRQQELDTLPEVGPLHGVPIGVKDIFYTAGIPTTACSGCTRTLFRRSTQHRCAVETGWRHYAGQDCDD